MKNFPKYKIKKTTHYDGSVLYTALIKKYWFLPWKQLFTYDKWLLIFGLNSTYDTRQSISEKTSSPYLKCVVETIKKVEKRRIEQIKKQNKKIEYINLHFPIQEEEIDNHIFFKEIDGSKNEKVIDFIYSEDKHIEIQITDNFNEYSETIKFFILFPNHIIELKKWLNKIT